MQRLMVAGLVLAFAAPTGMARAENKSDPTGTWNWTNTGTGGQARTTTLKLKLDGDKLTGAVAGILAQCPDTSLAARVGVLVHAMAGDAAARGGERGLLASDLARELHNCVNR